MFIVSCWKPFRVNACRVARVILDFRVARVVSIVSRVSCQVRVVFVFRVVSCLCFVSCFSFRVEFILFRSCRITRVVLKAFARGALASSLVAPAWPPRGPPPAAPLAAGGSYSGTGGWGQSCQSCRFKFV